MPTREILTGGNGCRKQTDPTFASMGLDKEVAAPATETIAANIRACRAAGMSTIEIEALLICDRRYIRSVSARMRKSRRARNLEERVDWQGEHLRALTIIVAELRQKLDNGISRERR
jgi:hypothetical protein